MGKLKENLELAAKVTVPRCEVDHWKKYVRIRDGVLFSGITDVYYLFKGYKVEHA